MKIILMSHKRKVKKKRGARAEASYSFESRSCKKMEKAN